MTGIDFIQDLGLVMLIAAAAGWLCQRIGLPAVIGYIAAGILVGPHTHSFALISNPERIQSLAQIGLIFLIFNIGQVIRLQRLRRIGLPLLLGTLVIAAAVLVGCRLLGAALGWPDTHSIVLAGMLMVSSTAVIGKSLRENNATHSRFGQTVLAVTALDDMIAVITLTVLGALINTGRTDSLVVFGTVIRIKAVIVTLVIAALLLVPGLLNRLRRSVSSDMRSLAIVGLLFAMALLSAKAGFSAALGAFLLGAIVSTTSRGEEEDRVLGGLCEVFAPVFFVAVGMLFDFKMLVGIWPLLLGVFLMAIVWRAIAATGALLLVGHPMRDAARAGLALTAIGDFTLIIALTGVQGGLVPESFYALAIGVCLLTSLTTPFLIRNSDAISGWIERRQPEFLARWIAFYHEWMASLKQRRQSTLLWKLTAPRLVQVSLLVFFVSGLLILARPLYSLAEKWLGSDWPAAFFFWFGFGVLLLAPCIALWRNIEALSMICAEAATRGRTKRAALNSLFERLLKGSALIVICVWFTALFPYAVLPVWGLVALLACFAVIAAVFWRRLIRLHSRFEIELRSQLADSPFFGLNSKSAGWPKRNGHLGLGEFTIRQNTQAVGRAISELPLRELFSCTLVSIERQGVVIRNPNAKTILYPNDRVLVMGREEDLRSAKHWLETVSAPEQSAGQQIQFSDFNLEQLTVPAGSRHVGKPLGQLALNSLFGIQIVGIERDQRSLVSPGRSETLQPGDQLLVLGTSEQVNEMAFWLAA